MSSDGPVSLSKPAERASLEGPTALEGTAEDTLCLVMFDERSNNKSNQVDRAGRAAHLQQHGLSDEVELQVVGKTADNSASYRPAEQWITLERSARL